MAEPGREGRGGRLRLLAGLALVMSAAAALVTMPSSGHRPAATPARAHPSAAAAAAGPGFEPSDANVRSVGLAMIIGVAVIGLSIAGLFGLLAVLHARDAAGPPLTRQQTATIVPPGPPLQANPATDLAALRRREEGMLSTYRWLSPDHDRARIPVDRAMALVVGRSLDPQPDPAP